jgi:uncharacterized protein YoaH (UPF0181 family)
MDIINFPEEILLMIINKLPEPQIVIDICDTNEKIKIFVIDNINVITKSYYDYYKSQNDFIKGNALIIHNYLSFNTFNERYLSFKKIVSFITNMDYNKVKKNFYKSFQYINKTNDNFVKYFTCLVLYDIKPKYIEYVINIPYVKIIKMIPFLKKGYNFHEILDIFENDMNDTQISMITRILDACPELNEETPYSDFGPDYSIGYIVSRIKHPSEIDKIIKYYKEGFDDVDVIHLLNQSDDKIALVYDLINKGVHKKYAAGIIARGEESLNIYLNFINVNKIDKQSLGSILHNYHEMINSIQNIVSYGIDFPEAIALVDNNNDTDENIQQIVNHMSTGMTSCDAYRQVFNLRSP